DAVAVEVAGGDVDAAGVADAVGPEAPQQGAVLAAEHLDHRRAGRLADDEIGEAVAVEVAGGHADAAGLAREGGEVVQDGVGVEAAEDLDPGRGGAGNDVGDAVVIDIADGDADAAAVGGGEGREAVQFAAGGGVVDRDQGPAAGADGEEREGLSFEGADVHGPKAAGAALVGGRG